MELSSKTRRAGRIACVLAAASLVACGASSPATAPEPEERMRVSVTSLPTTNGDRPLHCMVRVVEPAVALVEDYDQAAALIFTSDETLLSRGVVFPGQPLELDVTLDPTQAVAVYFFFTDPGDAWVVPVPAPVPRRLAITLGANEVTDWSPRVGDEGSGGESEEDDEASGGNALLPPLESMLPGGGGSGGGSGGSSGGGSSGGAPAAPALPSAPAGIPGRRR